MSAKLKFMRHKHARALAVAAGLCIAGLQPAQAQGPGQGQTFQTMAPSAILMDAETGSVLFEKAADQTVTPASTVKVMTAEIVFRELKEGRLRLTDEFHVSDNAWRMGGAGSRGSSMFAQLNSRIRVEDLLRGLLIVSGNDAGIILAEGLSGTEAAFAEKMTQRARELGLKNLHFRNAWGKDDPGQKVTARDMALLADHVVRAYPEYYRYFSEREFTWGKTRQQNRNPLLGMDIGADGLKTGNIDDASGYGLIGSAVQNNQRLILAIYGLRNAKDRAEEARKILLWGFRSFESKALFDAGETIGAARLYGGAQTEVSLVSAKAVRILAPRGSTDKLTGKIVYNGPIAAPVAAGQDVARLKIFRGNALSLDLPLNAGESVDIGPLYKRAYDAGMELGAGLFRKLASKN